jgi:ferritin-like metal-binding protein YciE
MIVTTGAPVELNPESLDKLICDELADLLHVENMLLKALPKLAAGAYAHGLKELFENHLVETRVQVKRLEKMFGSLERPAREKRCEAMMGLLVECQHLLTRSKPSLATDQALICAARKVESFEVISYRSLASWAELCKYETIRILALETADEEERALRALEGMVAGVKLDSSLPTTQRKSRMATPPEVKRVSRKMTPEPVLP